MLSEKIEELDLEKLQEKLSEWVGSEEGQRAIQEAMRLANETTKALKEARRIDWRRLHEPMTI